MSTYTSTRVWDLSKLSGAALIILLSLADRSDDDGYCWPGTADIAKRARIDERQVRRVIKQIEEAGELYSQRFGGRGRVNEYIVATGQTADEIARTLVRRFEMDMPTAAQTALAVIEKQKIKGDILAQKGVYTPPFSEEIKGDILPQKGDIFAQKGTLKGGLQGQKGTFNPLKGGAGTPLTINHNIQKEDILSSSPDLDFLSVKNAEENTPDHIDQPAAPVPVASAPGGRTPADIWQMALADLALSTPAPTFETWVRDTNVLSYEDGEFVIGVPHAFARDWLSKRLQPQIKRILGRLCRRAVGVTFRVREHAKIT